MLSEVKGLTDHQFFNEHPSRQVRIRLPGRQLYKNEQRAVRYLDECELQFRSLGGHDPKRRRIIVWRLPRDHPAYDPEKPQLLVIPFLAFADESIEDTDEVLMPILHDIMVEAAK